jgi:hypothetical protein
MASTKKDSIKLNTINGFDIYLDPANGLFFFTLKTEDRPRVQFATMRAAEDAARGDKEPIKVVVVAHNRYQHPEIVEIIGTSGWNLVTTGHKRIGLYEVYAYDKPLLDKLNEAADACGKAHQQWQWAVEEFRRAGKVIDVDMEDNIKTVTGEHKRAEGGILRVE